MSNFYSTQFQIGITVKLIWKSVTHIVKYFYMEKNPPQKTKQNKTKQQRKQTNKNILNSKENPYHKIVEKFKNKTMN